MNFGYRGEADALDAEILRCIEQRSVPDFDDLALRIFAHQLRYNEPYARYCGVMGVTLDRMPDGFETIPAVPSAALKETALCTFDPADAALAFRTSGTLAGKSGTHYMESTALYDAALLAGFQDAMIPDTDVTLRYLLLVPDPSERPSSSLGYMMREVAKHFGDGREQWFLHGDAIDVDGFVAAVREANLRNMAVCIAGTAFAFVQLLDAFGEAGERELPLTAGSRLMETGGFKGRTRVVDRDDLYASLAQIFHIDETAIVAEYGMTELTSQYYDSAGSGLPRIKRGPPWLRARVVGPDQRTLPHGIVGSLVHVDLANRSSCVAIHTEDLGVMTPEGGLVLIGREQGAQLRGCSLDAEQLRVLSRA